MDDGIFAMVWNRPKNNKTSYFSDVARVRLAEVSYAWFPIQGSAAVTALRAVPLCLVSYQGSCNRNRNESRASICMRHSQGAALLLCDGFETAGKTRKNVLLARLRLSAARGWVAVQVVEICWQDAACG